MRKTANGKIVRFIALLDSAAFSVLMPGCEALLDKGDQHGDELTAGLSFQTVTLP